MEKQAAEVCFAISKRVRLPGKGSDAGYACCPPDQYRRENTKRAVTERRIVRSQPFGCAKHRHQYSIRGHFTGRRGNALGKYGVLFPFGSSLYSYRISFSTAVFS